MANHLKRSSFPMWLVDPLAPTAEASHASFRFPATLMSWLVPTGVGLALLAVSFVGWAVDAKQFYFSYLVGWCFCLSISLGGLFFVLIQHLTKARWSVVVRRISEALIWSFPLLAVLGIPIIFGMHDLYHWTHEDVMDPTDSHYDPVLAAKAGYLNVPFFFVRMAVYFLIWCVVSYKLYTLSVRQDVDPDVTIPAQQRKVSAVGLALTALTTAFASYDLLMSLDPHWFSTIFGVYFFGASFWTAHAFIALVVILIQRARGLENVVTADHYHDLGKMMFGFTVFWAYIAFSQYMLIWYGNIPEETVWYRHRLEHGWQIHSAILLLGHFVIPFWILLGRSAKRSVPIMFVMAVWFMVMNWFDIHWIAMPVLRPDNPGISWLDVTCWLGLFGLFCGVLAYRLARHSLVPQNDPFLSKSLAFENR